MCIRDRYHSNPAAAPRAAVALTMARRTAPPAIRPMTIIACLIALAISSAIPECRVCACRHVIMVAAKAMTKFHCPSARRAISVTCVTRIIASATLISRGIKMPARKV